MVESQEKQPFSESLFKEQLRDATDREKLCLLAKALAAMIIPEARLRWVRNLFEQRVSNLGIWKDVPQEIEQARKVLGSEKNTPEQSVP